MKVLDLACAQAHVFEGWFASEDDFQTQLARGLIECPVCSDKHIEKRLSAPRLNLRTTGRPDENASAAPRAPAAGPLAVPTTAHATGSTSPVEPVAALPTEAVPAQVQALLMRALREVVARTEDVGEQFVTEVRRMHYGDVEPRNIRGQASVADAVELLEEGIDVLPLPNLPALKETLQ